MQQLTNKVSLPTYVFSNLGKPSYPTLNSFCQQQIEQIAMQVPVVAAWMVYQDREQYQVVADYSQEQVDLNLPILDLGFGLATEDRELFNQEIWSYIPSENSDRQKSTSATVENPILNPKFKDRWELDSLPVLTVSEAATAGKYHAYICLLDRQSHPEYLSIWSAEPLSVLQQRWIEQQAQTIANYLAVYREFYRQQAKIQLLEEAIQRAEHQLRNPLALIGLYAENLCQGLPAGIEKEQAEIIQETVQGLSSQLTDLLFCGQQAKLSLAPHDLQKMLTESIQGLQPWLEKKQVDVIYPHAPFILAVDHGQMKQVFDNLLSNAVHFSPRSGTITVNWHIFSDEVLFEVADRGPGLSQEDLKKAFTAFYSRRPDGTGLGLAIAKKIILDHHGSIWAENLPEGGAQFSFTLPRQTN